MASLGGVLRFLKKSDGTELNALVSQTATFQSETLNLGEFEEFGTILDWIETSGTGTYTVTVEISPDGGTTWWSMPEGLNSETAAGMTAVSATGKAAEFWKNPLPNNTNARVRFVFTAASSPTYTITAYISAQMVKRATDV
jgi:hypothetical protein